MSTEWSIKMNEKEMREKGWKQIKILQFKR